jgi:hypothetical protein
MGKEHVCCIGGVFEPFSCLCAEAAADYLHAEISPVLGVVVVLVEIWMLQVGLFSLALL